MLTTGFPTIAWGWLFRSVSGMRLTAIASSGGCGNGSASTNRCSHYQVKIWSSLRDLVPKGCRQGIWQESFSRLLRSGMVFLHDPRTIAFTYPGLPGGALSFEGFILQILSYLFPVYIRCDQNLWTIDGRLYGHKACGSLPPLPRWWLRSC